MDNSKQAILMHYASPYYDPVKAHEYYMKNRELKGRPTSALNDDGKKIWAYAKNSISSEKKARIKAEQDKRDNKIADLRMKAESTKEQISSRLQQLNDILTLRAAKQKKNIDESKESDLDEIEKNSVSRKERIENRKNAEIKSLMSMTIPSGLSKKERAKLIAARSEKIAKLRNDAKSAKVRINDSAKADKTEVRNNAVNSKNDISEQTKSDKSFNTDNAKNERAKVSSELKSAVNAAREAYNSIKNNLDSSYEKVYQHEYNNILSEYKSTKKTSSSTKKTSSSTKKTSHPLEYYIRK